MKVSGFRRLFNQEASWRETDGAERRVLNVELDADAWFNAILLPDVDRETYAEFRERERGYRLVEALDLVLVATGEKTATGIEPIPDYLELCLEGAAHWGEEFYDDFLATTEATPGVPLVDYLE